MASAILLHMLLQGRCRGMMLPQQINDPFHRKLYATLTDKLAERMRAVAEGSAKQNTGEVATTGEKYFEQTAWVQALTFVLDECENIENDQYGRPKPQGEQ
jgi:hypothetical protein